MSQFTMLEWSLVKSIYRNGLFFFGLNYSQSVNCVMTSECLGGHDHLWYNKVQSNANKLGSLCFKIESSAASNQASGNYRYIDI